MLCFQGQIFSKAARLSFSIIRAVQPDRGGFDMHTTLPLRWRLIGLAVAFLAPGLAQAQVPGRAALPNIVFVLADDMGYGDAACLNKDSKIATPNLDRLATEGMIFTDAHTGAAICTPTRYGLLTGRYAWRTGLKGVLEENSRPLIRADELTVARFLHELGYHTACIGKWHLGKITNGDRIEQGPITRGFDHFYGFQYARGIENLFENDRAAPKLTAVEVLPEIARRAVAYLDQRAQERKPFFLYLPLNSPHTPIVPSPEFAGRSGLDPYGDFVMQSDGALGQVLAALDRNQLRDNTLLIFASDNGSPHTKQTQGHASNFHFRGQKGTIYEGGHRVPFVARWPGQVKAGSTCPHTICLGDFLATCAELTQQKLPENAGVDSVSFLPHLLGKSHGTLREATVHHDGSATFALRKDQWVLIFPRAGKNNKQAPSEPELYDLAKDIRQTKNLAREHADLVADLTRLMQRYVDHGRSTPGPAQRNDVSVVFQKKML